MLIYFEFTGLWLIASHKLHLTQIFGYKSKINSQLQSSSVALYRMKESPKLQHNVFTYLPLVVSCHADSFGFDIYCMSLRVMPPAQYDRSEWNLVYDATATSTATFPESVSLFLWIIQRIHSRDS